MWPVIFVVLAIPLDKRADLEWLAHVSDHRCRVGHEDKPGRTTRQLLGAIKGVGVCIGAAEVEKEARDNDGLHSMETSEARAQGMRQRVQERTRN